MNKKCPKEEMIKTVNQIIRKYKILSVFFGLITVLIFIIYYLIEAVMISYAMSGIVYLYILYSQYMRVSKLKILKLEIESVICPDCPHLDSMKH